MKKLVYYVALFSIASIANAEIIKDQEKCETVSASNITKEKCRTCVSDGGEFDYEKYKANKIDKNKYCNIIEKKEEVTTEVKEDVKENVDMDKEIKPEVKEEKAADILPMNRILVEDLESLASELVDDLKLVTKIPVITYDTDVTGSESNKTENYREAYKNIKNKRSDIKYLDGDIFEWDSIKVISKKHQSANVSLLNPYHVDNKKTEEEKNNLEAGLFMIGVEYSTDMKKDNDVSAVKKTLGQRECQSMCGVWLEDKTKLGFQCVATSESSKVHKECTNYKEKPTKFVVVLPATWNKNEKPTEILKNILSADSFKNISENSLLKSKFEELDKAVKEARDEEKKVAAEGNIETKDESKESVTE